MLILLMLYYSFTKFCVSLLSFMMKVCENGGVENRSPKLIGAWFESIKFFKRSYIE